MTQEMEKLGGTSEEDDEEMEMGVKEDVDEDEDDEGKKANSANEMAVADEGIEPNSTSQFQQQHQEQLSASGGVRRCRPKEEKERTKLRERHRRSITARILAGLRRHGNYNLRVRADINDVIAALAREAGWIVLPDGTTFPSRNQGARPAGAPSNAAATSSSHMMPVQTPPASTKGVSSGFHSTVDYRSGRMKSVFMPTSLPYQRSSSTRSRTLGMVGDKGQRIENSLLGSGADTVDGDQVVDVPLKLQERDFAGTPYVPVYVMLPLGVINMKCELVDPDGLLKQLRVLKSINVDGIMVDCWWGIVEAHAPQEYNWSGYKRLFQIVRDLDFKLQVVMSFHECGGNVGDDVCIPLPHWVAEIGRNNPDIFFTDREGRRNPECLSWGIDKERVLRGRTAVECYDQYLLKSLRRAAEARGHSFWGRGPDNAGSYNSKPHETGFFCDGGDYDSYYGRFFLKWYSQVLIDHADRVLFLAKLAFEGTCIAAKLSGIHWWYKTASHAAELTVGFYNPCNRDGYAAIASMLKKHGAALNFTCVELRTLDQHEDFPEALADPEGLVWQVLNAAWDVSIPVASENALPCHDREGYNKILENSKPLNDPDGRHLSAFTYLRLGPHLMERDNFLEFERFVKRMHGEAVLDLQL
uniref:Beta-amylase n=1 Tax=Nelumbo nucifera TaxID=4432 RepID=A0A822ZR55_NELNU|nr:TPA_asm: hypothetical protein HUJ06_017304 [Nelumbo nucifera]